MNKFLIALGFTAILLSACSNDNKKHEEEEIGNFVNGHEFVDLGLSVKWATCNVGADKPQDPGHHYAWGSTTIFSLTSYDNPLENNPEITDIAGTEYDVAHLEWGGTWRMPTQEEIAELKEKCTYEMVTEGGVYGSKITGPNGNSIFLPADGSQHDNGAWQDKNEICFYWTATRYPEYPTNAYALVLATDQFRVTFGFQTYDGFNVRPVTK